MSPRVSVVMPVFDGEAYLREALDSILGQTLRELELVIVDDGSTDGSPAILAQYARSDPRVRVLRQEHGGLTPALNRGCRAATAPYIARMDADDIAVPDRLELQARFLDEHPRVGLLGGAFVFVNARGERLSTVRYPTRDEEIRRELLRSNCFAHPTVMMLRAAFEAVSGYRFRNAEDYDLWLRIAERYEVANLSEPVICYRHHPQQFSVSAICEQTLGVLAVRAAAAARRSTGVDPLLGVDDLTPAVLRELGVSEEAFEQALVDDHLRWAGILAEMGTDAAAAGLLEAAAALGGGSRRELGARIRLARAKASVRSGRRARAAWLASSAFVLQPRLVAKELARALKA